MGFCGARATHLAKNFAWERLADTLPSYYIAQQSRGGGGCHGPAHGGGMFVSNRPNIGSFLSLVVKSRRMPYGSTDTADRVGLAAAQIPASFCRLVWSTVTLVSTTNRAPELLLRSRTLGYYSYCTPRGTAVGASIFRLTCSLHEG